MAIFPNFRPVDPMWKSAPIPPLPPQKEGISSLFLTKTLLTIVNFQNGLIEHEKIERTEVMWNFSILDQLA